MNAVERQFDIFVPPRYIEGRFDRRMFNPSVFPSHRLTLDRLRQIGRTRSSHYYASLQYAQSDDPRLRKWARESHFDNHVFCCGSEAFKFLPQEFRQVAERDAEFNDGIKERYLDVGCGASPDAVIAQALGYYAVKLDYFPAFKGTAEICRADAIALPFADCSFDYVSSQAMIALLPHSERDLFYREVYRVLKIGGWFSMTGAELKCGYGFKQGQETPRARKLKWEVDPTINGFRAQRQEL